MADTASMETAYRAELASPGRSIGMETSWIDRLSADPPPSRSLQQATSSLEAEYAVLSEASAKNAELEAMLRNSQPLLWLENALVMQRKRTQISGRKPADRVGGAKPHVRFVDEQPLEFVESDLRHRRRVQWEIAKRIARVEREITKQPPGQRSWHVKEKQRVMEETKMRQEEENKREKQRREAEKEAVKARQEEEKKAKAKQIQARRMAKANREGGAKIERSVGKIPPKVDVDLDFEWPETKDEKPATALKRPRSVAVENEEKTGYSEEEKENAAAAPAIQSQDSPDLRKHGRQETMDSEPEQALLRIARESFETAVEVNCPVQENGHDGSESGDRPARAVESHKSKHLESSLGRQVLSEYRTMPTPVSFGAPAIIKGSQQPRRLNNDVLRRLFSDLDADRDGHLNRIETSVALHRLQIHVPAPRIVSFFKRIHHVDTAKPPPPGQRGKWNGPTRPLEPLKQVINYKQFVAFVTAAFDQEQQQVNHAQRSERRHAQSQQLREGRRQLDLRLLQISRNVESSVDPPSPTRSSSAPPPLQQIGLAAKQPQEELEVRLVEQIEEPLADRLLRELPDYLMSRALAESDVSALSREHRAMEQVVRRSLEKIVGSDEVADGVVQHVAQDLIRIFVEKVSSGKSGGEADDIDDTSGLGRAAAFFESLGRLEDADSISPEGGQRENVSADWWRQLTEEQVGALVQEIWRSREAKAQEPLVGLNADVLDKVPEESLPQETTAEPAIVAITQGDQPQDDQTAVETTDTSPCRVQRVAEKGIQTEIGDLPPFPPLPPCEAPIPASTAPIDPIPPPPPPPPSPPPVRVRSALARAVLQSMPRNIRIQPQRDSTATVLADLRRQRRQRQQAAQLVESVESTSSQEVAIPSANVPPMETLRDHQVDTWGRERVPTSEEAFFVADPRAAHSHVRDTDPPDESTTLPQEESPSPLPIKEQRLHLATSPTNTNLSLVRSSASSSGIFSSASSSGAGSTSSFSFFRRLDSQFVSQRRQKAHFISRRKRDRLLDSRESNEGPRPMGGEDDGDLSEGEIVREDSGDLSDGELFGATRRKAVRVKNHKQSQDDIIAESVTSPLLDTADSMESGEMLPSMIHIQRAFHQKLIASSVSSLESGEAEDGASSSR